MKCQISKTSGILLLIFVVLAQGSYVDHTSDEHYENADDYADYSSDDDYLNENEMVVNTIPEFVSESVSATLNEGETIKLPCFVDNLNGFTLIWSKGKDIIALGNSILNRDPRIKIQESKNGNGNTLVISLAEKNDTGLYECKLSANKPTFLTHDIQIRVKPEIAPVPSNGILIVREGESASLECKVLKGYPEPDITWRRKDRRMPSGEEEIRALSITFASVTRKHSGIYICQADNGFGPVTVSTYLTLDVEHAPTVEQEQTFIHTRENDETEVVCIVHASPRPVIEWFKNGLPLDSEQGITVERRNRHTLILPGIKESTFGTYTCRATNKYGHDERTTQVSGLARPANFKSDPDGLYSDRFKLEWVSESITPVTKFILQFRHRGSEEWSHDLEVHPTSNGDNFYSGRILLEGLREAGAYEARVKSQNAYGYNEFSKNSFNFGTKGSEPIQEPSISKGSHNVLNFHIFTSLIVLLISKLLLS